MFKLVGSNSEVARWDAASCKEVPKSILNTLIMLDNNTILFAVGDSSGWSFAFLPKKLHSQSMEEFMLFKLEESYKFRNLEFPRSKRLLSH